MHLAKGSIPTHPSHQALETMPSFPKHQLGKLGPKIPGLGLGLMGMSIAYGAVDGDEDRLKFLDRAYELGSTFWDTADAYGDNEDLLGKWFQKTGKRDDVRWNEDLEPIVMLTLSQIFLATKFAIQFSAQGVSCHSDPEYVHEACAKSLKRLGVDHIDLYYCHRVDLKTPIEKTVEAMAQLKK